jgi:hypothetical protein
MDAELSQPEQHQQDAEQQLQPAGEQGFALLELPRDALVAVLTAAGDMDEYRKHHLRALACSCQQLNLLVRSKTTCRQPRGRQQMAAGAGTTAPGKHVGRWLS